MKTYAQKFLSVLFVLFLLSLEARSDTLKLSNGDSIKGEFIGLDGDYILFRSSILGDLRVEKSKADVVIASENLKPPTRLSVPEASPAAVVKVEKSSPTDKTPSPEPSITPLQEANAGGITPAVSAKAAGEKPAPAPKEAKPDLIIVRSRPDGKPGGKSTQPGAAYAGMKPQDKREIESFADHQSETITRYLTVARDNFKWLVPEGWTGRISGGFDIKRTSSETVQINLRLRAERKWEDFSLKTEPYYNFRETTESSGRIVKNDDKYGSTLNLRRDLVDPFFLDYEADYYQDQVRNVDHYLNQGAGIGVRVIQSKVLEINIIPAFLFQYRGIEQRGSEWTRMLNITEEINYKVSDVFRIEHKAYAGRDTEDAENFRYGINTSGIIRMSKWIDAAVRYENNFDNRLQVGVRDEERLIFSLGLPF